jgi:hypothetical protein
LVSFLTASYFILLLLISLLDLSHSPLQLSNLALEYVVLSDHFWYSLEPSKQRKYALDFTVCILARLWNYFLRIINLRLFQLFLQHQMHCFVVYRTHKNSISHYLKYLKCNINTQTKRNKTIQIWYKIRLMLKFWFLTNLGYPPNLWWQGVICKKVKETMVGSSNHRNRII